MIGTMVTHYRIVAKLGEGGMGVVYKAQDTRLDRFVALKFLPAHVAQTEQEKSRFIQEAKSASALNHPNVCTIYGIGEYEGPNGARQQYIEMELVDGMTLRDKVAASKSSPFPFKQVVDFGIQIAEALQEAHSKGIVHRDVKSENIMVNSKNQIKVMDFGLAKLKGSLKLTRTSSTIGTLAYMSPEQIQGTEADVRSDIFSFGVVLFEMVTGNMPFRGEHEAAVMYSIVNEEPEQAAAFRPDVPAELVHIIGKTLEKSPEDRYQSMADLIVDLRRLKRESTRVVRTQVVAESRGSRSAAPSAAVDRTMPKGWKWKLAAGIGVLAVLATTALVFKYLPFSSKTDNKTIVVIPFENLGPNDKEYFVDGMTDEVTSRLSGLSGLRVIARSSAHQYKKTTKSFQQIADELGVGYVLQGTVRWEEENGVTHVRVNPSLIKVEDGTQVWSESMESILSSAFKLQSDIATRVASAMNLALAQTERKSLETSLTENSEAYDTYLRGLEYAERSVSKSDFEIAIQLLERAVRLDPEFAAAYAKLSYIHSNMYWFFYDRTEARVVKSRQVAEKALALAPQLSEAHEAMGWYYYHGRLDYEHALQEFAEALKCRPGNSFVHYGIASVLRRQGNMRGAVESYVKAIGSNPRAGDIIRQLGETQTLLRDYAAAEKNYDRALELLPDVTAIYWEKLNNLLSWNGDVAGARKILEEARRLGKLDESDNLLARIAFELEYFEGNDKGAMNELDRSQAREMVSDQFNYAPTVLLRARVEELRGNASRMRAYSDSARIIIEQRIKATPEDERLHSALGVALAGLGQKEAAIRSGLKGAELLPIEKEAWRGSYRLLDLARIYAMTGETDKAVDVLERLLAIPSGISPVRLKHDPAWRSLKENKRFQGLVAGV